MRWANFVVALVLGAARFGYVNYPSSGCN